MTQKEAACLVYGPDKRRKTLKILEIKRFW
jgi:hypothetical protein